MEFNLVKFDLDDVEDKQRTCNQHFNNSFIHESAAVAPEEGDDVIEDDEDPKEKRDEEIKTIGANKKVSKETRSLFKKIAKITHPDKMLGLDDDEREERDILYLIAQRAAQDDDLATLIEVAIELGIDSGIAEETQVKIIEQKIGFIREKIHNIKQTASWVWYHSDGEQKDQIEKQLTGQMGFKRTGL